MKYLFTALAICASTQATTADDLHHLLNNTNDTQNDEVALSPDFSAIEIDHAREYVELIYPFAAKIEQKRNIPAPVTIAIACLESGYGRSYYARTRNNHMGIRSFYQGKAGYRHFSSIEECFDNFDTIFNLERYASLKELEGDDLRMWVENICRSGYNHREAYIEKLMRMIRFLKLDKIEFPPVMA